MRKGEPSFPTTPMAAEAVPPVRHAVKEEMTEPLRVRRALTPRIPAWYPRSPRCMDSRRFPVLLLCVVLISVMAATAVLHWASSTGLLTARDIYAYFHPKMLYAVQSFASGGGLFWNPFQNCGQPFFALSQTGLLYPPHWLFLVLAPGRALSAVIILNHVIAGVGMFLLGRRLGASAGAAVGGMLALQVGTTLPVFSTMSLPYLGAYAWLPAAALATERLLAEPRGRRAVALALVLAVQWLAGAPQVWLLTVQLLGFRLLWALVWPGAQGRTMVTVWFLVGIGLAPVLAGIQAIPELAAVRSSLRSGALSPQEANPLGLLGWRDVEAELRLRGTNHRAIVPALVPIVVAGIVGPRVRRPAIFWAIAALLSGILAFGPATPLYELYLRLPGAALFRFASRLLWVTGFCFAVLATLAIEGLGTPGRAWHDPTTWGRLVLLAAGWALVEALVPGGLVGPERLLLAVAALSIVAPGGIPGWPTMSPWSIVAGLAVSLLYLPGLSPRLLLPDPPDYGARRELHEVLTRWSTPQERYYIVMDGDRWVLDYSLIPKTASILRLLSSVDYEPLPSSRYANFQVRMRTGRPLASRNQAIYVDELGANYSRRLLDLTASRWVLQTASAGATLADVPPLVPRLTVDRTLVLENPSALPRARWVPRVHVIRDPEALLERLATGDDDLRQAAFVEVELPADADGDTGSDRRAEVRFLADAPEFVELSVDAPSKGFVVLADQYDEGWTASIDGAPSSIVRANYAFRAVAVPAGRSTLAFRYRPPGLMLGIAATFVGTLAAIWLARR